MVTREDMADLPRTITCQRLPLRVERRRTWGEIAILGMAVVAATGIAVAVALVWL